MTPGELADELARHAEQRIEGGGLGLVCAVASSDGEPHFWDVPPAEVTGPASVTAAWDTVRALLGERNGTVAGVAADVALVDDESHPGDGDAYEVHVESVEGTSVVFFVGYRVRRFRGLQVAGRVYSEPDHPRLSPEG